MFARLDPNAHEGHVAGDDVGLPPVDGGGEAFVKRDREDQNSGLLRVDMGDEAVCGRVKAVAGVLLQAGDAFLPIGDGVHVERLHARLIGGQLVVVKRHGGEQHGRRGLAVHPLVVCAGAGRLQKAHRQGVGVAVYGNPVFVVVVNEAVRHGRVVEPVIRLHAQQRAQRRAAIRRADGGGFVKPKARHRDEASDDGGAQAGEGGEAARPAQKPVVADLFAVVDALPFGHVRRGGGFKRRFRDFGQGVEPLARNVAAGEQVFVAH